MESFTCSSAINWCLCGDF